MMIRSPYSGLLLILAGPVLAQPIGEQLDRRDRREPAVILRTGGRTGTCDVLKFTPSGDALLAVGDDKAVTDYPVTEAGLNNREVRFHYWPAWREQRGSIYAMDISKDGKLVAIGGLGMRNSSVAVIDRASGAIKHMTFVERGRENFFSIMSLAFSANADRLAISTGSGHVAVWDFRSSPVILGRHEPAAGSSYNRVRAVRIDENGSIVTVAESGTVTRWTRSDQGWTAQNIVDFSGKGDLRAAVFTSDGSRVAAGTLNRIVHLATLDGRQQQQIDLGEDQFPRSLAWSPDGKSLAVGTGQLLPGESFRLEADESIRIFDVSHGEPVMLKRLPHTGRAEALAWHGDRLAVAGGDNHEVTLWNLRQMEKPQSVARGGGAGIWSIALSEDGRYVAFSDRRNAEAKHPNHRGTDDLRYFDLNRRRFEKGKPENATFVTPLETAGGWTVVPDAKLPWQWHVVDANGQKYPLPWDRDMDNRPTCFTFLKPVAGQPVQLAVGHYWGFSVFELSPGQVRRSRLFTGHQGEVSAICPSADGTWLVTASPDQTISAWNLKPWPSQTPLGMSTTAIGDAVRIDSVDAGSPAWEMGLTAGDEIILVAIAAKEVFISGRTGTPQAAKEALDRAEPGREVFVTTRRAGRQKLFSSPSFLRTRPMWRFLPGADREWVLWMWLGSFYDCSTNGDSLVGWLINDPSMTKSPTFYKLEQFREQFNRPDVIEELISRRDAGLALKAGLGDNPVAINLGLNEPPMLRIEAPAVAEGNVKLRLIASPRGDNVDLQPQRVALWINDYRAREWQPGGQPFDETIELEPSMLRAGANKLTLQSFNRLGGRAEITHQITNPRPAESRNLLGLGVAVNDYSSTTASTGKRGALTNLNGAIADVQMQVERWSGQEGKLYQNTTFVLMPNQKATRAQVLAELDRLAKVAKPDDRLLLFLSGHGEFKVIPGQKPKKPVTTFYYCCHDFDQRRPAETGIDHATLYEKLSRIPCRKVVFLDACHSGEAAFNPVRVLTPAGQGPIILAACDRAEFAYEHPTKKNGLFTLAILHALGDGFSAADRNGDGDLDPRELIDAVQRQMPALLREAGKADDLQNPQCFPARPESFPLYRR